jgi:glycosyltransferase involved in cell wall biosynthesis
MRSTTDAAFFVPRLTAGGAQRVTLTITAELADRGYAVDLVLAHPGGGLRGEAGEGVRVVDLQATRLPGVGLATSAPRIRSYLRDAQPEVFVSTMTFANVVCLLASIGDAEGTKLVAAEHTTFGMFGGVKNGLTRVLAKHLYPRADRIVAVSEGVAESVVAGTRVEGSDVTVIYNPVDVDRIREGITDPVDHPWLTDGGYDVVLGAGRIAPQKDFPTLVRAFERLRAATDRDDLRLIVTGDGEQLDDLRSLIERRGLDDFVDLPGYVDDIYAYMDRADVFALSSAWEGLPTVLIESLTVGTPVVATDCPSGPREILQDGELGPLVPVGDAEALARAIAETLADPPAPDRLRDRADDFSPPAVVDDYAALIDGRL